MVTYLPNCIEVAFDGFVGEEGIVMAPPLSGLFAVLELYDLVSEHGYYPLHTYSQEYIYKLVQRGNVDQGAFMYS